MKLRIFLPATDRAEGAAMPWMLFGARRELLREGTGTLDDMPRADEVELALPAARVLFARLKLPRVNAATIRELLPYAVEDRLLADPSHIHAVAGATDGRGETVVAVIDREWLQGMLDALARAGLRPVRAWCESALLAGGQGDWNLVLGQARGMLVDDVGVSVTFDRDRAAGFPLALRIALDEASARGDRPGNIRVHTEGDAACPDLARWSAEAGVALHPGTHWEELARAEPAAGAINLLTHEFDLRGRRFAALRVPRAALFLAAAMAAAAACLRRRPGVATRAGTHADRGAAGCDLPRGVSRKRRWSSTRTCRWRATWPSCDARAASPAATTFSRASRARPANPARRCAPSSTPTAVSTCGARRREPTTARVPSRGEARHEGWTERSPHERLVLGAIAGALAAVLVVTLVWLPLERTRARLARELPALRASIATLQDQADEVRRLRAMPAVAQGAAAPLASLAAVGSAKLSGAQVAVVNPREVRIAGSDVGFASLLEWLQGAQASHGLQVESARIEALPTAGRVRADIVLARP